MSRLSLAGLTVLSGIMAVLLSCPIVAEEVAKKPSSDPWCRLDDPGTSETERRKLKLSAKDLSQLTCPAKGDPQQRPEELLLPMPCGRAMVFRRVTLQLRHIIDQRKAYLGTVPEGVDDPLAKPSRSVVTGPREAFISGSLSLGKPSDGEASSFQRGFYIGKYEVTELQYEIYRQGLLTAEGKYIDAADPACKTIIDSSTQKYGTLVLPVTRISWFEALDFGRAYTEWLLALDRANIAAKKSPGALPWEESTPGFLRLPTSEEWEYAARGADVAPAAQSARLYDVIVEGERRKGTLEEIASVTSPQNPPPDGSDVHYVGRKLPNILGLYDMIGNASEITLDLFSPRRPDQLSGILGGYIQMGGSAGDSETALGVGERTEVPLFKKDGLVKSPSTGFRLVISSPFMVNKRLGDWKEAIGNPQLDAEINKAYQILLAQSSSPGAEERAEVDKKVQQLQQDLQKQKEELGRQRSSSEDWKKQADQLQEDLKKQKDEIERQRLQEQERTDAEKKARQLQQGVQIQKEELEQRSVSAEAWQKRIVQLEEDLKKQKDEVDRQRANGKEYADAEKKAQQLQQDLQKQKEEMEQQRAESEAWKKYTEQLQEDLKKRKDEIQRQRASSESWKKLSERLQENLKKQKEEIDRQYTGDDAWKKFTEQLQMELKQVKGSLDRSTTAINEREAALRVELVRSVILIASNINAVDRQIRVVDDNMKLLKQNLEKTQNAKEKKMIIEGLPPLEIRLDQLARSNDGSFRYYVETTRTLAQSSTKDVLQAASLVRQQFQVEGNTVLNAFQPLVLQHIDIARNQRGIFSEASKKQWLKEIKAIERTSANKQSAR